MIVEDNPGHLKITEYILRDRDVRGNYIVVRDGQECLDYLFRKKHFDDHEKFPLPDLILLDLNLPQRDGREVLKLVKEEHSLKSIPVVIVSTSDREEDVSFAFQNGAAAYISKSSGFETFSDELGSVKQYVKPKR
jgi:CheY-like chemotaxis protein